MNHKNILIADSGSTKTDWCLLRGGKRKIFYTQGINPFFLQESEIVSIFSSELGINPKRTQIDEIHFYGAGINSEDKRKIIQHALEQYFGKTRVQTHSDMLASARATCRSEKGISCILGTGSNTCYFDGKKISFKTKALGYVLGDEGGGTYLGRKVLQYYMHGLFDVELIDAFHMEFRMNDDFILENLYRKPFANRFVAQFANFVLKHRGHYMIENIAEDSLNDLFINHLLRYPQVHKVPVHFTGTVAFHLQDMLASMCHQYEITLGRVLQKPIEGLIDYHRNMK